MTHEMGSEEVPDAKPLPIAHSDTIAPLTRKLGPHLGRLPQCFLSRQRQSGRKATPKSAPTPSRIRTHEFPPIYMRSWSLYPRLIYSESRREHYLISSIDQPALGSRDAGKVHSPGWNLYLNHVDRPAFRRHLRAITYDNRRGRYNRQALH